MKLKYKSINKNLSTNETEITFTVIDELESLLKWIKTELYFDLSIWIDKRSKEANRYFWKLLREMARKLNSSSDEMYLLMLEKYGVFEIIPRLNNEQALAELKQKWRLVVDRGDCEINDTSMRKLKCFYGSSTYNIQEMWHLINGTVGECIEMGIDTKDPNEIERICQNWKV
jgi:hypothetical protein